MPGSGFYLSLSVSSQSRFTSHHTLTGTENPKVLEHFCFCQNKTQRSPKAAPGAEQELRQRMMLCEEEKNHLKVALASVWRC